MLSRRLTQAVPSSVRGYATKVSAVDFDGRISSLTVKVNAGSRYAPKDGLSHLLSRFNFQNTKQRSALRLTRESELLGGNFQSNVERDSIYLTANFLKESLPYFVKAIGDVLHQTSFRPHEFPEIILPAAKYDLAKALASPTFTANELLHAASFRNGLGRPLYYDGVEKVTLDDIKAFSAKAYTQSNVEIYGKGVNQADLEKFVEESAFAQLPTGTSFASSSAPQFFEGVETRQRASGVSVAAIAVPVAAGDFATYEVLTNYVKSSLFEHSSALEAKFNKYEGAGLFTLFVKGEATSVTANIKAIAAQLKQGQDISAAAALTATELALSNETSFTPYELDVSQVKNFKLDKFNYVALGDVNNLPYADEL